MASQWGRKWQIIKKPLAATMAVVIAALCTIVAEYNSLVKIDPGSVVFITILLVDMGTTETFYVTAFFRIVGTLLGLGIGAGVSFISNALVSNENSIYKLTAFRLSILSIVIFIPLWIDVRSPKYSYASKMFIYTVTSLIFSGLSNATTIAMIVALVGGILIATLTMWLFDYDSAEAILLEDHKKLIKQVFYMMKISVRANPTFRDDYFKTLDDSKESFTSNIEGIQNYERWMKWTRRIPPFDFIILTNSLRPLYHQAASLFWSLCREKMITVGPATDPIHLYCSNPELYFGNYHEFVVKIVDSIDRMEEKLVRVLETHPRQILESTRRNFSPRRWWHKKLHASQVKENQQSLSILMEDILKQDIQSGFIRHVMSMKKRFYESKNTSHIQFNQKWLMSEYLYQLLVVIVEVLDYLVVVTDTVVRDEKQRFLRKKIRSLLINIESISKDGFITALGTAITSPPGNFLRPGRTSELLGGDENLDEVESQINDFDSDFLIQATFSTDNGGTRQFSIN